MNIHSRIQASIFGEERPCQPVSAPTTAFAIESPPAVRTKRVIDLLLAFAVLPLVLAVALPVFFLASLQGGSPLFRHLRIGRGGQPFYCYKFRSMTADADAQLQFLLESNHLAYREWSEQFKLRNDPRITRIGYFLRKTSLDELPQIWNILTGDMSFVGPRPIIFDELEKYGEFAPAYLACRPGISGLWQVNGRNNTSYEERVAYDAEYAQTWSVMVDVKILLMTIPVVITGKGSY